MVDQIPVVVRSPMGFSWYNWVVKDDLFFDELNSANPNYLALTTTGVWVDLHGLCEPLKLFVLIHVNFITNILVFLLYLEW